MPPRLAGATAFVMLGHLSHAERGALWSLLAARLAPGASALIAIQPSARPVPVPRAHFARTRLDEHHYEGWARAVAGPDRLRRTMTYRTPRGRSARGSPRAAGFMHDGDTEGLLILRPSAR